MSDPEGYVLSRRFNVRSTFATLLAFKTEQGFGCNWTCECGDVCLDHLTGRRYPRQSRVIAIRCTRSVTIEVLRKALDTTPRS